MLQSDRHSHSLCSLIMNAFSVVFSKSAHISSMSRILTATEVQGNFERTSDRIWMDLIKEEKFCMAIKKFLSRVSAYVRAQYKFE